MELYKPNGKISAILPLEGDIFNGSYTFNTFSTDREVIGHVEFCSERIRAYYGVRSLDITSSLFVRFEHVAIEMLIDTLKHGVFPVTHRLSILEKGVYQGFRERGDFLKREDIKQKVESRTPLKKITHKRRGLDHGRGFAYVYVMSDEIEVDTKNGILWTAHLRQDSSN